MKTILNTLRVGRGLATRYASLTCSLLVLIAAGSGCQKTASVSVEADPTGSYALTSINGKQVPCTLNHEGASLSIKAGNFLINSDGTCSSKMDFSAQSGPTATREVKATYTRQGPVLTMKWEGAGVTFGSVQGNTFTMTNEGMVLAYTK